MTTPDQQAAIERVRYWKLLGWQNLQVNGIPIEPGPADVLALLDAYDARGKEIEVLKSGRGLELLDTMRAAEEARAERDDLKAKLEAVRSIADHRVGCSARSGNGGYRIGICTCGLSAALEGGKP